MGTLGKRIAKADSMSNLGRLVVLCVDYEEAVEAWQRWLASDSPASEVHVKEYEYTLAELEMEIRNTLRSLQNQHRDESLNR